MIPVVTPEEMKAIDQAAPESTETLVERAGGAVARRALRLLGGGYGRRVVVVAGKGNNGADGRAAAERLRRRGAKPLVIEAAGAPDQLPSCDLVIDAAYGTGFHGDYQAPDPGEAPVLAVDIPSGVDGLTGTAGHGAVRASATVTFAALKPGLLLDEGRVRAGSVEVADIGLDVSGARIHLVQDEDLGARLPARPWVTHKWRTAVMVVAGSPGMMGAPLLVARGAMRSGAGYVRLAVPGAEPAALPPGSEAVAVALPGQGWARPAMEEAGRARAMVVGPGVGRDDATLAEVRHLVSEAEVPMVVDADGLLALGPDQWTPPERLPAPRVLTPHDGEFERLTGARPEADRIGAARRLAERTRAVVLLKGPTTVVSGPGGDVLLSATGDPRLATAGTGDVLSGVVAAFMAQGMDPFWAAGIGAHVHGTAARSGHARGLVAGDLPDLLAAWLSDHA